MDRYSLFENLNKTFRLLNLFPNKNVSFLKINIVYFK